MNDCRDVAEMLRELRRIVREALEGTSLRGQVARFWSSIGGGKMLRARLLLCLGPAGDVAPGTIYRAAAAVEMLHAASLLHDDILDGGTLRRGHPALWVTDGTKAAVILGDLLVSLAVEAIQDVLPSHLPMLTVTLREMCDAEAEQEFAGLKAGASWGRCVDIARRKTGSLFGFAAACAGGSNPELVAALRRAGYALGTAYQLADDLLDACAAPLSSDKTLGLDAATGKLTASSVRPPAGQTAEGVIESLLRDSESDLVRWPRVQAAWHGYVRDTMAPLLARFAGVARVEAIA